MKLTEQKGKETQGKGNEKSILHTAYLNRLDNAKSELELFGTYKTWLSCYKLSIYY